MKRVYVYGLGEDGTREFLSTFLDEYGARKFIDEFRGAFKGRFENYIFGQMADGFEDWEVFK
jgi:hypothetical protein